MDRQTKELGFRLDGKTYSLLALNDWKIVQLSAFFSLLHIDSSRIKENYALEFLRVARLHADVACIIIALCTSRENDCIETISEFQKKMDYTDIATLLIVILIYYTDDFNHAVNSDGELGKEAGDGRNSL